MTFERPIKKKEISLKLKEKCAQLTKVTTKDITKNLEILCHALTETQEVLLEAYTILEGDEDRKDLINQEYEKPSTDVFH